MPATERKNRAIHLLAVLAITAFFGWHAVRHAVPVGLAGPQSDGLTQGLPKLVFYADELRAGRFPTWDPWVGTGSPDYPVRHHPVYPFTWLTARLLPPWLAMLADYWLAFLFLYAFACRFFHRAEATAPAAAAGALALAFGGLQLHYLFYPYFSQTMAWIPLVFLALEGLFRRPDGRWREVAAGAAALGLMLLAGMLNYAVYTLLAGAAWVLFQTWDRRPPVGRWASCWLLALGLVAIGFLAGAARWLPLLDGMERLRGGYAQWDAFQALLTTPARFFGSFAPGAFSDYGFRRGATILSYGLTAWTLAASFAVFGRKSRTDWFWLAVLLVGLATTTRTPLAHGLFDYLPGYGSFHPARYWCVGGLALLWLTVRALGQVAAAPDARRLLGLAAALAAVWMILGFAATPAFRAGAWKHLLPAAIGLVGLAVAFFLGRRLGAGRTALLLAAVLALEVYGRATVSAERIDTRRLYRSTPIIEALKAVAEPYRVLRIGDRWNWVRDGRLYTQEALKYDRIEDLHAYSSMIDPDLRELVGLYQEGRQAELNPFDTGASVQPFLTDKPLRTGFADGINARFILSQQALRTDEHFRLAAEHGGLFLYENVGAMPRAFVPRETPLIADPQAVLNRLRQGIDWHRQTIVTGLPGDHPTLYPDDGPPAEVAILRRVANRQTYRVHSPAAGFLVVTDLFDRDWRATVNGRPEPIRRADLAFRAVPIPAGESEVDFIYRPAAFAQGARLSLGAAALLCLLLLAGGLKDRVRTSGTSKAPATR